MGFANGLTKKSTVKYFRYRSMIFVESIEFVDTTQRRNKNLKTGL
jgi:hypothetical protein